MGELSADRLRRQAAPLIELLRQLLGGAGPRTLDPYALDDLLAAARHHGLAGALDRILRMRGDLPATARTAWASERVERIGASLSTLARISSDLRTLEAAEIAAMAAPDPGLLAYLTWDGDSEVRHAGLLVGARDVERAAPLVDPGVQLRVASDAALQRARIAPVAGRAFRLPAPADALIDLGRQAAWQRLDLLFGACLLALSAEAAGAADVFASADALDRLNTAVVLLTGAAVFGVDLPLGRWAAAEPGAAERATMLASRLDGPPVLRPLAVKADVGTGPPRKLVLHQLQAPGDIVMLTAAVRDLHRSYPGAFLTDVRTSAADLWRGNPHITSIDDRDPDAEHIQCEYPLIHASNEEPVHFVRAFTEFLNARLGLTIRPSAFRGDLYLSRDPPRSPGVRELIDLDVPYWILCAGGKTDFTIKWWSPSRYQELVDRYAGRVLFAQVGELEHRHPAIDGAIDLRGRTSISDLIALVHHADGVVAPVSLLMHLAAAVPVPPGRQARGAVVIAGGREPAHWEAYPGHQFLHTIGTLPCCASGGCWRSRTLPMGDGDSKDDPAALCVDVVDALPRCMDAIAVADVAAAVGRYIDGGVARALSADQAAAVNAYLARATRTAEWTATRPTTVTPSARVPHWYEPPPPSRRLASGTTAACVVVRGDDAAAIRQRVEALAAVTDDDVPVVVGAIAIGNAARAELYSLRHAGAVDRVHESPTDIEPRHMAERMVATLPAEHVWWFGDGIAHLTAGRGEHSAAAAVAVGAGTPAVAVPVGGGAGGRRSGPRVPTAEPDRAPVHVWRTADLREALRSERAAGRSADRIILTEHPTVGLVIGTFAAVPFVHLALESRRRHYPHIPVLVHDDGSPMRPALEALCRQYGADFTSNPTRLAQCVGDLSAFADGLEWGRGRALDLVVKMSRRFIPLHDWVPPLQRLAWESQYATFTFRCEHFNFGFRSECVAMHVASWTDTAIADMVRRVKTNQSLFVEAYVHNLARKIHGTACAANRAYERTHPKLRDTDAYGDWHIMPARRVTRRSDLLWHDADAPSDYARTARLYGLPYGEADYEDPNQGFGSENP